MLELSKLRMLCGRPATDAKIFATRAAEALHGLEAMGYVHAVIQNDEDRIVIMPEQGQRAGGGGGGSHRHARQEHCRPGTA